MGLKVADIRNGEEARVNETRGRRPQIACLVWARE
jgi:hypothetical protein